MREATEDDNCGNCNNSTPSGMCLINCEDIFTNSDWCTTYEPKEKQTNKTKIDE